MNSIKFVYFDVGGVSVIDYSGTNKWKEMKRALGVTEKNDRQFEQVWKKYRERICVDFDVDEMIPELQEIEGLSIPNEYSMLNDFVERFELNQSIWPVIQAAKKKYKVGLLTNMYPRMLEAIVKKGLLPQIDWDAIVDSSIVGYQKPDPDMYKKAEELAKSNPEEILFTDNSEEHLSAAMRRGWATFLYDPQNPESSSNGLLRILNL